MIGLFATWAVTIRGQSSSHDPIVDDDVWRDPNPPYGSSASTCCASIAKPSMPLRISVRPQASHTRAPDGKLTSAQYRQYTAQGQFIDLRVHPDHCAIRPLLMPYWRATSVGDAPGAKLCAAIVCFCSIVQRRLGKHIVAVGLGRVVHSFAAGQGLRRSSKNLLEEFVSRFCYGIIRLCASRSPAIPEYTPGSPGFPPAPTDFPPAIPVGAELSPVGGELDKSETRFPPAVPVAPPAIPIVACSDRRVARKNSTISGIPVRNLEA